jgi:hypothetical protein
MDEVILRRLVIQFDGRVVEVFDPRSDPMRYHVAQMREPSIGATDHKGRVLMYLQGHHPIDPDEMPRLVPLLDKIRAAVHAAQVEKLS